LLDLECFLEAFIVLTDAIETLTIIKAELGVEGTIKTELVKEKED
jgi:hypothetical protein